MPLTLTLSLTPTPTLTLTVTLAVTLIVSVALIPSLAGHVGTLSDGSGDGRCSTRLRGCFRVCRRVLQGAPSASSGC